MEKLLDFIELNDVEKAVNRISKTQLGAIQNQTGMQFGEQLTRYILDYGYLAFESVEFYGINSLQGKDSDMIKQTLYLYEYFPCTKPYVAIENRGDANYSLIDKNDRIIEFMPELNNVLKDTGQKLFEYILNRFEEV